MSKKPSLMDRAKAAQSKPRNPSAIDRLLDVVSDSERAEILALLKARGEVQHSAAALVLNEAFEDRLTRRVTQQQVAAWRERNGVA